MTSGGNNFNDFSENQLTKFRAVLTVLRQIETTRFLLKGRFFINVNMNSKDTAIIELYERTGQFRMCHL